MEERHAEVLRLRSRQHAWDEAVHRLYDLDPLFLEFSVIEELDTLYFSLPRDPTEPIPGPSQGEEKAEKVAEYGADLQDLLSKMVEARPEEGAALESAWKAWWESTAAEIRARHAGG